MPDRNDQGLATAQEARDVAEAAREAEWEHASFARGLFEGRFALEDTRKAIMEARGRGLSVYGITIDDDARDYFPFLFGPGRFTIIRDPVGLPGAMPGLFRALLAE